jgi:coatomer subunit alpha
MVQHDTRARFSLAIDSGNLEVAYKTCHEELKDKDCYAKLGEEALRQGNHQIVEVSYQKTKTYDKLAFLYMLTGNSGRLEKMLNFAQNKNDVMSRFQIALYLGDIHERIRILAEVGLRKFLIEFLNPSSPRLPRRHLSQHPRNGRASLQLPPREHS